MLFYRMFYIYVAVVLEWLFDSILYAYKFRRCRWHSEIDVCMDGYSFQAVVSTSDSLSM